METKKTKKYLTLLLKLLLTGLAFYIVGRKIDVAETWQLMKRAHPGWLLLAVVMFNVSKTISALRLNRLFTVLELYISDKINLKLYYIGMFYNLFLPGGIGGDGYKIYYLNRHFDKPVKQLFRAVLLDRISGMTALLFLALLFAGINDSLLLEPWLKMSIWGAAIIGYPAFYLFNRILFKRFTIRFFNTNLFSLGVQGSQVICAYFLLQALAINDHQLEYLLFFLVSSVITIIPFTPGGAGARELVFVLAADYSSVQEETAVAFTLLFFIITSVSSLFGAFLSMKRHEPAPSAT
ncbi:MAG: lysylphosphatidylglycerol synthase transmembrane domain-containing protein [Bacteroidota bacterium]